MLNMFTEFRPFKTFLMEKIDRLIFRKQLKTNKIKYNNMTRLASLFDITFISYKLPERAISLVLWQSQRIDL